MNTNEPKVVFNALDRNAEIEISERNLPHWFQVGAATFVTFRTHDSLPRDVLLRWQREEQFRYLQDYIAANPAKASIPQTDCIYWHRDRV